MISFAGIVLLAMAPQTPQGTQPDPRGQFLGMVGPLVLMVIIFYFLLIRPQQRKAKEHAQLLKAIRRGDEVITSGGIIAEVVTVKEKSVVLRSADAKFEVTKSSVTEITKRSGEAAES